jgi:transposase-like protein
MRRYRSRAEWQVILEEYATSGKSLEAFCQERDVSESSIYRRLRKRSEQRGEFVELAGVGSPRALSLVQYEVSVNGVTIRIPSNERVARIAELVRALGC